MELTEDTELGQRLLDGDQSSLQEILRAFGGLVLALLRRRYREILREEDLEDVLSIGLFRLWNSRQRYQPARSSLRVWWYRICENSARDVLRLGWQKARAREVRSDPALLGISEAAEADARQDPDGQSPVAPSALQQDLRDVLSELPEVQRVILLADAAARESVACSQRLSDELGIPASTVRVYRKRAMDRLRAELMQRGHAVDAR